MALEVYECPGCGGHPDRTATPGQLRCRSCGSKFWVDTDNPGALHPFQEEQDTQTATHLDNPDKSDESAQTATKHNSTPPTRKPFKVFLFVLVLIVALALGGYIWLTRDASDETGNARTVINVPRKQTEIILPKPGLNKTGPTVKPHN